MTEHDTEYVHQALLRTHRTHTHANEYFKESFLTLFGHMQIISSAKHAIYRVYAEQTHKHALMRFYEE